MKMYINLLIHDKYISKRYLCWRFIFAACITKLYEDHWIRVCGGGGEGAVVILWKKSLFGR